MKPRDTTKGSIVGSENQSVGKRDRRDEQVVRPDHFSWQFQVIANDGEESNNRSIKWHVPTTSTQHERLDRPADQGVTPIFRASLP